jgi:hypothetical protein
MRHGLGKSLAAAAVLTLAVAAPASAATLADWEMNEGPGATTMIDSSGHVNGTIGSDVVTGVNVMGATAYRWPFTSPTQPPAQPERIVQANSNSLNPNSGTYTVSLRFRTTQNFGNIVQKGQAGATGGYFKVENPNGRINCVFRGRNSSGTLVRKAVQSPTSTSNGAWHVATCTRTSTGLTLTIDGSVVARASGSTGSISNTRPVTIGGKLNCDQVNISCDYYTGDIDWVRLSN